MHKQIKDEKEAEKNVKENRVEEWHGNTLLDPSLRSGWRYWNLIPDTWNLLPDTWNLIPDT